ncbi:hypothetical protein BC832DRAFT_618173 [Gaertneriomyces semiglobifer]|nr:hypothetical protein BC832DRAFT_618173 [Gaertneriomyces semiglobifer]
MMEKAYDSLNENDSGSDLDWDDEGIYCEKPFADKKLKREKDRCNYEGTYSERPFAKKKVKRMTSAVDEGIHSERPFAKKKLKRKTSALDEGIHSERPFAKKKLKPKTSALDEGQEEKDADEMDGMCNEMETGQILISKICMQRMLIREATSAEVFASQMEEQPKQMLKIASDKRAEAAKRRLTAVQREKDLKLQFAKLSTA